MDPRKANEGDLPEVFRIFQDAIRHMRSCGIEQWDEVYPDLERLREDISEGFLYVLEENGRIAAAFVLTPENDEAYGPGRWRYPAETCGVLHRLCVDPAFQGRGIGAQAVLAAERILTQMGGLSMRLDAFSQNPAALSLYEKLGYARVGEVHFRKGLFYLFEKKLPGGSSLEDAVR